MHWLACISGLGFSMHAVCQVWRISCARTSTWAWGVREKGGQLPILIYWNPSLPIFYPIPSRTGVCTHSLKTLSVARFDWQTVESSEAVYRRRAQGRTMNRVS